MCAKAKHQQMIRVVNNTTPLYDKYPTYKLYVIL